MLKVGWKITVGDHVLEAGKQADLLFLEADANLDVPLNGCRVVLEGRTKLNVKPGDPMKVELGYEGALNLVFTGLAATVQTGIGQREVHALSSFASLTGGRWNARYEKQAAGQIAADLLEKASVGKGITEDGEKFASFTVSDRQPVWECLRGLADRCGFDFYADTEDKAIFAPYKGETVHEFRYGAEILSYEGNSCRPPVDGLEVFGESPASQGEGDEASSWLSKKLVKGTAGKSSGNVIRMVDPAARTESTATALAGYLLLAEQRNERGEVKVVGSAEVRLGDAVKISGMEDSFLNGQFKVTGVRHRVSNRGGFVTWVRWERS